MNTEKQLLASIGTLTSRLMENKISSVAYQMTDATAWYHEGTFLSLIGMVKFDIFHGRAEHE